MGQGIYYESFDHLVGYGKTQEDSYMSFCESVIYHYGKEGICEMLFSKKINNNKIYFIKYKGSKYIIKFMKSNTSWKCHVSE